MILVHLVGFITRIYHDARSSECQNVDIDYLILYGRRQYIICVKSDIDLHSKFIQVTQLYVQSEGTILQ